MLQIKPSWNAPLERCRELRVSRPHRVSVFGYDARDTWRITVDGEDWGRAEEWETERPPVREQRDLLLQVFPGRREAVLTVHREQGRFLFRRGEALLGSIELERRGLLSRWRTVQRGERAWASLRAAGEGFRLEGRWGAAFAQIASGDAVSVALDPEAVPDGDPPLETRLLILAVALSLAADLPVVSGDWRQG